MPTCNTIDVSADKTVNFVGDTNLTNLLGLKNDTDLAGTADKLISLLGESYVTTFTVTSDKTVNLLGLKDLDGSLQGLKFLDASLLGSLEKSIPLSGDGLCDGFWYITVDNTYITIDNTHITIDRNPV